MYMLRDLITPINYGLDNIHRQYKRRKHKRHDQRQPGPMQGYGKNQNNHRYKKQDPV